VPTKLTERHSAFSRLTYGLCDGDDDVPDRRLQPPIILDRFKLVYVPIAGCGSTAVKLALHRALGRPDPEPVERVHRFPWPASDHGSNGDGVRLACRSFGFRGLAFVRDPWARLHWAWETLFVKERFGLLRDHHDHLRVDMDFRTFVRQLVYIDVTTAAEPLRRQVDSVALALRIFRTVEAPPPAPPEQLESPRPPKLGRMRWFLYRLYRAVWPDARGRSEYEMYLEGQNVRLQNTVNARDRDVWLLRVDIAQLQQQLAAAKMGEQSMVEIHRRMRLEVQADRAAAAQKIGRYLSNQERVPGSGPNVNDL
jgi:hypothetical protein